MTWERRLSLTRLWLQMHAMPLGLAIVAIVLGALFLLVYLPPAKATTYEGTVDELGFREGETGRRRLLWVKLDQGQRVTVRFDDRGSCRKGDRITVIHLGGHRGYTSGVTGCRRPTLPQPGRPG